MEQIKQLEEQIKTLEKQRKEINKKIRKIKKEIEKLKEKPIEKPIKKQKQPIELFANYCNLLLSSKAIFKPIQLPTSVFPDTFEKARLFSMVE